MKKNVSKVKFGLFLVIIMTSIIILLYNLDYIKHINLTNFLEFVNKNKVAAAFIYIGFYFIKPFFICLPTNVFAILSGTMFGPVMGFILTMIGFFISGTVAFYISRVLGREFVEGIIGDRTIKLDNNIEKNGFKILFLLRLPPILPYDPLSYACGFTKIKYKEFILASVLGVLPETMCYTIIGKNFSNPFSLKFIIPILILIIGLVLSKNIISSKDKVKS